jgi:hypothetical protein
LTYGSARRGRAGRARLRANRLSPAPKGTRRCQAGKLGRQAVAEVRSAAGSATGGAAPAGAAGRTTLSETPPRRAAAPCSRTPTGRRRGGPPSSGVSGPRSRARCRPTGRRSGSPGSPAPARSACWG